MLVEYSTEHISLLLKNLDDVPTLERVDIGRAVQILNHEDRHFLAYVVQGYSLRESGRRSGLPGHTSRRFQRICRNISMFLDGGRA